MRTTNSSKQEIFETMPIGKALRVMALPAVMSQLIALLYNLADTWFIGRTENPYMVGAVAMVATVFLMVQTIANVFGTGGGTLVVNLLGAGDTAEAEKTASLSLIMAAGCSIVFSVGCWFFMTPLLEFLGAGELTFTYARQYLIPVVVIGTLPTVLANTMSFMLRNVGYSKEAAFGLTFAGLLNMALDPLFMFVLLPDGLQVFGAGAATLIANICSLIYFVVIYLRVTGKSVLRLPKRVETLRPESMRAVFSIGLPAGLSLLFYDLTNMMLNRVSAGHGDLQLAAMGLVLKVERLPLNIGIGICLGMAPLIAYNFAAGNRKRMDDAFRLGRSVGLVIAAACVVTYYAAARGILGAFINEPETVAYGVVILRARCFATPFMFLSFHMVYLMQAVKKGKYAFLLAFIRQLCLNIPMLLLLNALFGMEGLVWSQVSADILNVTISYLIYFRVRRQFPQPGKPAF